MNSFAEILNLDFLFFLFRGIDLKKLNYPLIRSATINGGRPLSAACELRILG